MPGKPSKGKLLYHTTLLTNIPSILEKGLLCRQKLSTSRTFFYDIADEKILEERNKGNLSKYVPFHFFSTTPFEEGLVLRYGWENLAIVSIFRPNRADKMSRFKVIPSHPLSREMPKIMPYKEGMNSVRWDVLDDFATSYEDETQFDYSIPANKTATMAECLVADEIEPREIAWIFVRSKRVYDNLMDELENKHPATQRMWRKISHNWHMFPDVDDNIDSDEEEEYENIYYDE